jgi:hypothetical protein
VVSAARRLASLLEELEREGTSVIDLVRGDRPLEVWTLYPDDNGVFDRGTRSQFYFHVHDGADHEAGHFHTVHLLPDSTAHLVAISMASSGWPQALFTLNLWAIGDRYLTAAELKHHARRFRIDTRRGDRRLVRFINLIFQVFLPEIEHLQEQKVDRLVAHQLAHPGVDPFADRSLEILSRVEIDVRERASRHERLSVNG